MEFLFLMQQGKRCPPDPDPEANFFLTSYYYMLQGNIGKSAEYAKKSIDFQQNLVGALNLLGAAHAREKVWTPARECFQRALSIDDTNICTLYNLATLYGQTMAFVDQKKCLNQIRGQDGLKNSAEKRRFRRWGSTQAKELNVDHDLGVCLLSLNDYENAIRLFLRIHPSSLYTTKLIIFSLLQVGR